MNNYELNPSFQEKYQHWEKALFSAREKIERANTIPETIQIQWEIQHLSEEILIEMRENLPPPPSTELAATVQPKIDGEALDKIWNKTMHVRNELTVRQRELTWQAKTAATRVQQQALQRNNNVPAPTSKEITSYEDLAHFFEKESKRIGPVFRSLLEKHTGAVSRKFTADDIEKLDMLQNFVSQKLTGEASQWQEINSILSNIYDEVAQALRARISLLDKAPACIFTPFENLLEHELSTLQGTTDQEKELSYYKLASDFYADFHCPLELSIPLEEFHKMLAGKNLLNMSLRRKIDRIQVNPYSKKVVCPAPQFNIFDNSLFAHKSMDFKRALYDHKMEHLRMKVKEAREKKEKKPQVLIIGGGPGGLINALVAGMKGANVRLFEKREASTRRNVVKVEELDILEYFGVSDLLAMKNERGPFRGFEGAKIDPHTGYSVRIAGLEMALKETIHQLIDGVVKNEEHSPSGVVMNNCELVDIRPGYASSKGKIQTGCAIRSANAHGEVWYPADLIIDSSGSSKGTTLMGHKLDQISSTRIMITARYEEEGERSVKTSNTEQGEKFTASFSLYPTLDPEKNPVYLLIQPLPKDEARLRELFAKDDEVSQAQARALAHSIAASANTSQIEPGSVSIFPVSLALQNSSTTLDGCLIANTGDRRTQADPVTGTGTFTALSGGRLLSKMLEDSDVEHQSRAFNFGSDYQTAQLISKAELERTEMEKSEKRTELAFGTVGFAMQQLVKARVLTENDKDAFHAIREKIKNELPLTPKEYAQFRVVVEKWNKHRDYFTTFTHFNEMNREPWISAFALLEKELPIIEEHFKSQSADREKMLAQVTQAQTERDTRLAQAQTELINYINRQDIRIDRNHYRFKVKQTGDHYSLKIYQPRFLRRNKVIARVPISFIKGVMKLQGFKTTFNFEEIHKEKRQAQLISLLTELLKSLMPKT